MNRALRRWAPLLAVSVLLVAAWAAAALSSPELNQVPVPKLLPTGASGAADDSTDDESSPSPSPSPSSQTQVEVPDERDGLIGILALGALVAIGGAVTWYFVRRRIQASRGNPLVVQRPGTPRRRSERAEEVVAAIDAGITELSDNDADPRRAVIACWVRLEQAAAAAGTPRRISDSPTDLVLRLLSEHRVSPAVLDGFAEVYREARFATHQIDEDTRTAASAALHQVRAELRSEQADRTEQFARVSDSTTGGGR